MSTSRCEQTPKLGRWQGGAPVRARGTCVAGYGSMQRPTGAGTRPRVLIVEGDRLLREAIADALRVSGYGVRTAEEGPQAAATLRREAIDVVLADLDMAGRGYGDLARALESLPHVGVICLAGQFTTEAKQWSDALRAAARLVKPLTLTALLRHLRGLVRQGRSQRTQGA